MLRNFLKYQRPGQPGEVDRPTNTRWLVVAFAVSLAVLQYVDRVCISLAGPIRKNRHAAAGFAIGAWNA